jgi:hypothetical protein
MPHPTPREDVQAARAFPERSGTLAAQAARAALARFGRVTWTERAAAAVLGEAGAEPPPVRSFAPEVVIMYLLRRAARPRRRGPLRSRPPK